MFGLVVFPFIGFDMAPYTTVQASALYDCVAFAFHDGKTLSSGHYTTFSKRGGHWYCFDDGRRPRLVEATAVSSDAETTKAHLIFYVRRT